MAYFLKYLYTRY